MTTITISQLKVNPAAAFSMAADFPVAVQKRNKIAGYILGSDIFEKIIQFLEDIEDRRAIAKIDFSKGRDFEEFAKELGI